MRKRKEFFPVAVGVRIDQPTMGWLEQRADEARMPVSTYVRHLIDQPVRRDLRQKAKVSGGRDE
jgi:hypothetical protein